MNTRYQRWRLLMLMLVIGLALGGGATTTQAQSEIAAACNGGTGTSAANGGAAALGDVASGDNAGNVVTVGDTGGGTVSGGAVANSTDGMVNLDGGTGISDASSGDDCIAFKYTPAPAPDEPADDADEAFRVCVVVVGADTYCGPGNCTGPNGNATCKQDNCNDVPAAPDNCRFEECDVNQGQNRAECVYFLP